MYPKKPKKDKDLSPRPRSGTNSSHSRKKYPHLLVSKLHVAGMGINLSPSNSRPCSASSTGTYIASPRAQPRLNLPYISNISVLPEEEELIDPTGNIKVVVRVRPQNKKEIELDSRLVVKVLDPQLLVFDPPDEKKEFYFHGVKQKNAREYLKREPKDLKFVFDHVYGTGSSNSEIFEDIMRPLIDTVMLGYNCSVFAYGATGSGKTHTMVGKGKELGLTYLTILGLYSALSNVENDYESNILVSYMEVYNEQVRDLLNKSTAVLNVMETENGVIIPKLSTHTPRDAEHVLELLKSGNARRTQHPTDKNKESSRSHAVLQVFVSMRGRCTGPKTNYKGAKLVMVDLAGSERGTVTGCQGTTFREGSSINRSLLALGNCIKALANENKRKTKYPNPRNPSPDLQTPGPSSEESKKEEAHKSHIPYRDSKLTRILKDSLGGECKTVMIAAVSPSFLSYSDSHNTLKYANSAKDIKFHVKKNEGTFDTKISQYIQMLEEMGTRADNFQREKDEMTKEIVCFKSLDKEKTVEIDNLKSKIEEMENIIRTNSPLKSDRSTNTDDTRTSTKDASTETSNNLSISTHDATTKTIDVRVETDDANTETVEMEIDTEDDASTSTTLGDMRMDTVIESFDMRLDIANPSTNTNITDESIHLLNVINSKENRCPAKPKPQLNLTSVLQQSNSMYKSKSKSQYDNRGVMRRDGDPSTAFSKAACRPSYLFGSMMSMETKHCITDSSFGVVQMESFKEYERLLKKKAQLHSRVNEFVTKLRDLDCKLKQKKIRIKGAKSLAAKESTSIKRLEKQYNMFTKKKQECEKRRQIEEAELSKLAEQVHMSEDKFLCDSGKDAVVISRQDYAHFKTLITEQPVQTEFIAGIQPSFSGLFEDLVKTEELLRESMAQLKHRQLILKSLNRTTQEDDQCYNDLLSDYMCSRIRFATEDSNENTVSLSPYYTYGTQSQVPTPSNHAESEDESSDGLFTSTNDQRT